MKQKGVALILVLWVLSILTLMASSFTLTMRRESAGISHVKANAEALAQAQAGLVIAQTMLLQADEKKLWRIDGSLYEIETENAKIRIRILAEMGRVDINSVTSKLLHHILQFAPLDTQSQLELENAILDWRDDDDTTRPFGAEKEEYKVAKLRYAPRNKPFRSFDELQLVKGVTTEVFEWMKPIFTIYAAGQTEVDSTLSTRYVLNVLPEIDATLLDAYFLARQKAIVNQTPMPKLPRVENATQAMTGDVEATTEAEVMPDISVVTVSVEAQMENDVEARIDVVLEKMDGANNLPFQVLAWQNQTDSVSLFSDTMNPFLVAHYNEFEMKAP